LSEEVLLVVACTIYRQGGGDSASAKISGERRGADSRTETGVIGLEIKVLWIAAERLARSGMSL
jgi:hypothetical protein